MTLSVLIHSLSQRASSIAMKSGLHSRVLVLVGCSAELRAVHSGKHAVHCVHSVYGSSGVQISAKVLVLSSSVVQSMPVISSTKGPSGSVLQFCC